MRTVSQEFAALLAANHTLLMKATLNLANGTTVYLTSEDFMAGTARFEQAVSSDGTFDVGGAIIGSMSVTLANHDGRFNSYDLNGAGIVAYVGKTLSNNTTEWLKIGTYDVIRPDSYSGTIGITCSDMLNRLARNKYTEMEVEYPIAPQALLTAIVSHCGLSVLYDETPVNDTYLITRPPDTEMTMLDAAGYLAQIMGYWLRCDGDGRIVASWYDTSAFDSNPDTSIHITDAFSTTVMADNVTITGVQVRESDEITTDDEGNEVNGAAGRTILYGTTDYCLSMNQNPFIAYGHGEDIATGLYSRVGEMTFRPYRDSIPCDPTIEAGDAVTVYDRRGNPYASYVTGVVLKPDGAMETRCSAKSAASNSNVSTSKLSMTVTSLKSSVARSSQTAEAAVKQATSAVAGAEQANSIASHAVDVAGAAQDAVDGLSAHFWADLGGAHVGTVEKKAHETGAGYNMTLGASDSAVGIILDYDDQTLVSLTQTALNFYAAGLIAASYAAGGMSIFSQGIQRAAFNDSGVIFFDGAGASDENILAKFGSAGVIIGASGGSQVAVTPGQLSMLDSSGETVAYVRGGLLGASKADISDELDLGSFAWIPRSNGNLALKWMGGTV